MTAATAALHIDEVSRTFATGGGIRNVSFTAMDRSVTAVIGPNGAGKTVLFSIIAGLLQASSGHVDFATPNARVAYCPDVPQFEPWLTALEVVETSIAVSRTHSGLTALDALEECGLDKVAHRRVSDFSRGMLQRLGIAAALVLDPDVLILDEPNSALDPIGRADVRAIIARQKEQRCILLSSHMLSEVEQLADEIVVLSEGRLVASGSTAEILTRSLDPVWTIRLGQPAGISLHNLALELPDVRFEFTTDNVCTASFTSFEAARTELTRALTLLRSPLIEVTLQNRDLDASFARIIQKQDHS